MKSLFPGLIAYSDVYTGSSESLTLLMFQKGHFYSKVFSYLITLIRLCVAHSFVSPVVKPEGFESNRHGVAGIGTVRLLVDAPVMRFRHI